jgi:hypothetical protein
MRLLALAQLAQVLAAWEAVPAAVLVPFLRQLALHGEFVRRNLEVSSVAGNHYAANLAALVVAGATLAPTWPGARNWVAYARPRLWRQVRAQFLPDGVQFEKSVAYHRLVTELCLVAMLADEAGGATWPVAVRARLQAACGYTAAATRCDGWAANLGDNDGARVLAWDAWPLRDHRALLALGAVVFGSPALRSAAMPSAAVAWHTGRRGLDIWRRLPRQPAAATSVFPQGGMLAARGSGGYLLVDYGEVGQRGLGGHGHNDLFSFELCLRGTPVIVDAGSPVYSGDLSLQRRFRATAAHNTIVVDGGEMAPLLGPWRIANVAAPRRVQWHVHDGCLDASGEHAGFSRPSEEIVVSRHLRFDATEGRLWCEDRCQAQREHRLVRRFHFAAGLAVTLDAAGAGAVVRRGDVVVAHLRWEAGAEAAVEDDQVSDNYGQCAAAATLQLSRMVGSRPMVPMRVEITAEA